MNWSYHRGGPGRRTPSAARSAFLALPRARLGGADQGALLAAAAPVPVARGRPVRNVGKLPVLQRAHPGRAGGRGRGPALVAPAAKVVVAGCSPVDANVLSVARHRVPPARRASISATSCSGTPHPNAISFLPRSSISLLGRIRDALGDHRVHTVAGCVWAASVSRPRLPMVVAIRIAIGPSDAADISDLAPGARTAPATDRAG